MDMLQATGQDADWGGQYANAELTFMCLDSNDAQYTRKQMQFQPNCEYRLLNRLDKYQLGSNRRSVIAKYAPSFRL